MVLPIDPTKPETGPCQSFIEMPRKDDQSPVTHEPCTRQGKRRIHNGTGVGIHCDSCYESLLDDYNSRCW